MFEFAWEPFLIKFYHLCSFCQRLNSLFKIDKYCRKKLMYMVELYHWDILSVAVELVSWSHFWGYVFLSTRVLIFMFLGNKLLFWCLKDLKDYGQFSSLKIKKLVRRPRLWVELSHQLAPCQCRSAGERAISKCRWHFGVCTIKLHDACVCTKCTLRLEYAPFLTPIN